MPPRTDHHPRRHGGVAARLAILVVPAVVAGGCSPGDDSTTTGCESTVKAASEAIEVEEQVRLLDDALLTCRSYGALRDQLERYPGIIGYDVPTFVALRCADVDDETREGPTCSEVVAPTTTVPPTTIAPIVFVGETLDGRLIEMSPPEVAFTGDVPTVVQQTYDIYLESGCDGVYAQRDQWLTRVTEGPEGDEASVYAKHAENVAAFVGCDPR